MEPAEGTGSTEMVNPAVTVPSASEAETEVDPAVPSVVKMSSPQVATTGSLTGPVPKVWEVLTEPKVLAAGGDQLKSSYSVPLPASCSESPTGVPLASDTPMSVLDMPMAGPSTAVKAPS